MASHELKTPLTSLMGFTELLQRRLAREGGFSERNQRTLHSIHEQAMRLNRLIGSLLDISRIETGQLQLELASVELGDLTQGVVSALQPTLEQHQLVLERPAQPLVVTGEALRLEQVLHNLVSNAIKYSPSGGLIRVQVSRRNNTAVIIVS
ncbi:MAG TPA: histidine kinase dimerization/phospho-acceptor domain-containing protein, partial [Roseiflexaceae bacterium]|nr:histidine kinase dimerization/phospho-acceptor domain-containing protein [Roseiflexaceae bacterium]